MTENKEAGRSMIDIGDVPVIVYIQLPSDLLSLLPSLKDVLQTFAGYVAEHL